MLSQLWGATHRTMARFTSPSPRVVLNNRPRITFCQTSRPAQPARSIARRGQGKGRRKAARQGLMPTTSAATISANRTLPAVQ